ncbi:MAG: hypothetical protein LBC86_08345 [Oscillospiraceae bacterium]|jgi:lysylphosphatidylglycerol synthetase-like protein (DUF2156 family)|nr:hypothetical protein [Oscillospiraceae bacterium]
MRRVSYLSIILFIITAWFLIFFFWNFIEYNNYVAGVLRNGGLTFRGDAHQIIGAYMNNCAPYLFYALVMGTLGWLLMHLKPRRILETSVIPVVPVCDCTDIGAIELNEKEK